MVNRVLQFSDRWAVLILIAAALIFVTVVKPYHNGPAIRSDGVGYHLWFRAIVEGDFSFCNTYSLLREAYETVEHRCRLGKGRP